MRPRPTTLRFRLTIRNDGQVDNNLTPLAQRIGIGLNQLHSIKLGNSPAEDDSIIVDIELRVDWFERLAIERLVSTCWRKVCCSSQVLGADERSIHDTGLRWTLPSNGTHIRIAFSYMAMRKKFCRLRMPLCLASKAFFGINTNQLSVREKLKSKSYSISEYSFDFLKVAFRLIAKELGLSTTRTVQLFHQAIKRIGTLFAGLEQKAKQPIASRPTRSRWLQSRYGFLAGVPNDRKPTPITSSWFLGWLHQELLNRQNALKLKHAPLRSPRNKAAQTFLLIV